MWKPTVRHGGACRAYIPDQKPIFKAGVGNGYKLPEALGSVPKVAGRDVVLH